MGTLEGKIGIITGAGSGIGRSTAERFTAEGARIVVVDFDGDAAAATAEAIGGVAVAGSVAETATWEAALAAADALGGLDVVHLNAGLYGYHGPIEEVPIDVYQRTVAANIDGVVLGVRATVPALRARGGGAIVATASVAGIVAFAPNPLYTMTKMAVTGFVCAQAPNLVADHITFNAVCPGIVDTPMTVEAVGGGDPKALGLPLIDPATIADVVLHLATTEGTGRCVAVLPGRDPISWRFPIWQELANAPGGTV